MTGADKSHPADFVSRYLAAGAADKGALREHLQGCSLCTGNLLWWFTQYQEGEPLQNGAVLLPGIETHMQFLDALDQWERQRRDVLEHDIGKLLSYLNSSAGLSLLSNLLYSIREVFQGLSMPWNEAPYLWKGIGKLAELLGEQTFQRLLGKSSQDVKEWVRQKLVGSNHVLESAEGQLRCLSCGASWEGKIPEELLGEVCPSAPAAPKTPPLRLMGQVSEEMVQRLLERLDSAVAKASQLPAQVVLWITSPGGSETPALGFYEAVKTLQSQGKLRLHTVAAGQCSSAALLLYLAGNERSVTPNTRVLVHQYQAGGQELADFSPPVQGETEAFDSVIAGIFAAATNGRVSEAMALQVMREGRVFTAEQCIELGIAHRMHSLEP